MISRRRWATLAAVSVGLALTLAGCGNSPGGANETTTFNDCANASAGPAAAIGFDPATGEQRWARLAGDRSFSLDVGGVLVTFGADGPVGYDPATGSALWCEPITGVQTHKPAVVDGIFALVANGAVEAHDGATGQKLWSVPVVLPAPPVSAELVADGAQFIVIGDMTRNPNDAPEMPRQAILRLDAHTGAVLDGPAEQPWLRQSDADAVVDIHDPFEIVVVSDPATGVERWRVETPFTSGVLLDSDSVFISNVGSRDARVASYAVGDGHVQWEASVRSPNIFISGNILFSAFQGGLAALDRTTGEQLWTATYDTIGRVGKYTEAGWFPAVAVSHDGSAAAGMLVATEPHRD